MTASAPERRDRGRRAAAAVAGLLAAAWAGCAGPATPTPTGSAFEPLPTRVAYVPGELDRAGADVARAVLRGDRPATRAQVERVRAREAERSEEAGPSGVLAHALDAGNALREGRARRRASRELLERDDVPAPLRARVEAEVADDPLRLADARLSDARTRLIGTVVNGIMQPVGRSLGNALLLPYRLAQSVLGTALELHQEEELSLPERQALAHWKQFVEANPESPEAAALLERIREAQAAWYRTRRDRQVRAAERALEAGEPLRAAAHAERALRYRPEDPEASALRDEARDRVRRWTQGRRRSLAADPAQPPRPAAERPLAVALLRGGDVEGEARALLAAEGEAGPLADEARLALALARARAGAEREAWEELAALAEEDPTRGSAARHAEALVESPIAHPARAFERANDAVRNEVLRWVALGPLAHGARDRDLPRPVEWLVEIPALVGVVAGLPNRVIRAPFLELEWNASAVLARRYLERWPDGAHAPEMRGWLVGYEADRGNHVGALRLLEAAPDPDPEQVAELRAEAAAQALEASLGERRRDVRRELLAETAREFEGTEAGAEAGRALRRLVEDATPHHIRVSRSFLRENPRVAGPQGLALRPGLLDGELGNGELHPEGVALLGGLVVELAFVGPDGRQRGEPERVRERISEERLARVVALLEESQHDTLLTDRDARVEHDADRDRFFERARLGLADRPDLRPHAESTYTFLGMRERYGLVRGRESVLPVEIVLQGSFDDWSLGAFPRIRMPKPTPDAFLYR